ncbi:MAG: TolB family protein [Chloroflexota bacterium]
MVGCDRVLQSLAGRIIWPIFASLFIPTLALMAGATLLPRADAAELAGVIFLPRDARLMSLDMITGREYVIPIDGEGAIGDVAGSSDGSLLALSRLARRQDGTLGRDINVFPRLGGPTERVIEHDSQRVYLGSPAISQDSRTVLFDRQDASRPPSEARVEQVSLVDGSRRVVALNARAPSPQPDGSLLAFVRWGAVESLLVRDRATGAETAIVDSRSFLAIASPKFAPNGDWIAFSAVSEVSAHRPFLAIGSGRFGRDLASPSRHGFPWEVWRIRPDGTELQRLTELGEDEPTVAWSPDGDLLAVYGGLGLTLVDPMGGRSPLLIASGGFGGIGWLPAR